MTYPGDYEPQREAPHPPPYIPPNQPVSPYPPTAPIPYQPYPPQQIIVVPQQQTPSSTLAVLSLIFGILGLISACCAFGIPSAAAVILGHFALHETKDGKKSGNGMATAGLVIGYIVVIPAIVLSIMMVFGGLIDSLTPTPAATP
jgi:hypothetical protein